MAASFQKTQFTPVAYTPPENLPACRHVGSHTIADRRPALRSAVVHLRPLPGVAGAEFGSDERYTVRRVAVGGAGASIGRFIDVYA
jgi:hypothetical protein